MTVTALYRYPVKSMLGESVPRVTITERGVVGDRGYALFDIETGLVASAKVPKRWKTLLDFSARYLAEPVLGEELPPVEITFPDASTKRSDDPDVDARLSAVLGREVKLVTTVPEGTSFEELWPEIEGIAPEEFITETTSRREDTGEAISALGLAAGSKAAAGTFFDLCALHVLTESTLTRLRELAPDATFDARRYRPNIVLGDAGDGFVENTWAGSSATIGGGRVTFAFSTMRCVMTTLGQGDLPNDPDTLRAIAKHNRIEIPEVGGKWPCAGVYAEVSERGDIAVGDAHETPA